MQSRNQAPNAVVSTPLQIVPKDDVRLNRLNSQLTDMTLQDKLVSRA